MASSKFDRLPKETQELLNSHMLAPIETESAGFSMASKGATPEVISVEVPAVVPKLIRSPRLKANT